MNISDSGISFIEGFEKLELTAYQDSKGVWTIGWGHVGSDVYEGLTITQDQADQLLSNDLNTSETCINNNVSVDLTQNQFDALCSFVFNVGTGGFASSTLLRLLNAGNYSGAAQQFPRWNKSGGVIVGGLTRRRAAEQALFLGSGN